MVLDLDALHIRAGELFLAGSGVEGDRIGIGFLQKSMNSSAVIQENANFGSGGQPVQGVPARNGRLRLGGTRAQSRQRDCGNEERFGHIEL